ncbi:MAG: ATP-binding protein [Chlamydiales bacterium]|nr:ATP-binding protein [Chlamydiales bacterium]
MKAWNQFCESICEKFGKDSCQPWLNGCKVIRFDARNLYLELRDAFVRQWFEQHIRPLLKEQLFSESGHPIKVHISVKGSVAKIENAPTPKRTFEYLPDLTPSEMSFDTFISDSITPKLLKELLVSRAQFNPVFLYGPPGSGKTHLLSAFANAVKGAFYVRAQTFTEHVVNAMRTSDMDNFRKTYRNINALLIDDISVLKGRCATQEEFFHTFNALHTAGVQIIVSSRQLPQELEGIEKRLISRFEWGITLSIEPPSQMELSQILASKIDLNADATAYVIKHFDTSSKLSKAIEALLLRTHMQNITTPLTELKVAQLLSDLIAEQKKTMLAPQTIVKAVADHFEVRSEDLLSRSQSKECTLPRQIAMFFIRQKLKMPYTKIGEHFGRDHSTVMSSCKNIEKRKDTVARALKEIEIKLS